MERTRYPISLRCKPIGANQGVAFTLSLTNVVDPSSADMSAGFTYAFDCGEGAGFGAATTTPSMSCTPAQIGPRIVRSRVTDKDGGVTSYSANITSLKEQRS